MFMVLHVTGRGAVHAPPYATAVPERVGVEAPPDANTVADRGVSSVGVAAPDASTAADCGKESCVAEYVCTSCFAAGALRTLKALGPAALVAFAIVPRASPAGTWRLRPELENVIDATAGDVRTVDAGMAAVRTGATGVAGGTTTDFTCRGGTTKDVAWWGGTTTDVTGLASLDEEAATSADGAATHGAAVAAATDTAEAMLTKGTNGRTG